MPTLRQDTEQRDGIWTRHAVEAEPHAFPTGQVAFHPFLEVGPVRFSMRDDVVGPQRSQIGLQLRCLVFARALSDQVDRLVAKGSCKLDDGLSHGFSVSAHRS
jgi:hypothetical protein